MYIYIYFLTFALRRALVSVLNKKEINLACLPARSSVHSQEKHVKQRRRRRRSRGKKKAVKLKQYCKKEKQRRLQG